MKKIVSILALFALLSTRQASAQATNTRLIAHAYDIYDGLVFQHLDSSNLSYTGTRGGKIDVFAGIPASPIPTLKFDTKTDLLYNAGTGVWNNRNLYLHTFDAQDNILTEISQSWNAATGTWENYSKNTFTYTPANQLATYVNQTWNTTTGSWDNNAKFAYTYNAKGNTTSEIRAFWNTGTSAWQPNAKLLYNYNSNNLVDDFISQSWTSGSSWVNNYHQIYSYTGTVLDLRISQLWNTGMGIWDNNEKNIYTYTATNKMNIEIRQRWISGSWINHRRFLYAYTPGDDLDNAMGEEWDSGFSVWITKEKDLNTWDANHNKTAYVSQQLNASTLILENRYQSLYTYTADKDIAFMESKQWDLGTGTWQYTANSSGQSRFYYETYTTGIKPIANTVNCILYPVPASDVLNISVDWETVAPVEIAICNMYGHVIHHWEDTPTSTAYKRTIPVQHLATGNYMIRLSNGNQVANKVFTVTR